MLAVKQLFGIDMPIRTVGEYLRRWGFAAAAGQACPEQDPARLKAWLEDEYRRSLRAKTEDAEIYWGRDRHSPGLALGARLLDGGADA